MDCWVHRVSLQQWGDAVAHGNTQATPPLPNARPLGMVSRVSEIPS